MVNDAETRVDWNEVAVVALGTFENNSPEQLVRNMGRIASSFVSPLPQDWEHDANGGMAWARNSGLAQQIGREWALTDVGKQELARILGPEPTA